MASSAPRDLPTIDVNNSEQLQQFINTLTDVVQHNAAEHDTLFGASGADSVGVAPTNSPAGASITTLTNDDGSRDIILTWTYTQGTVPADFFAIIWKSGTAPLGTLSTSDNSYAVDSNFTAARLQGLSPELNYKFGIAAGRRGGADAAPVIGAIIEPDGSGGAPDWEDLTFGDPKWLGSLVGAIAHSINSEADTLFHFDGHALSTQGLAPKSGGVFSYRQDGKFGKCVAIEDGTTNDLSNGDFATGTTSSWTVASATATIVALDAYGYTNAVTLEDTSNSTSGTMLQTKDYNTDINGNVYTISCFARILDDRATGGNAILRVEFLTSGGAQVGSDNDVNITSSQWTLISQTLTAPATAEQVRVTLLGDDAWTGIVKATAFQLELLGYSSSFVSGIRAAGKLEYDKSVLSIDAGTIFCWYYVTNGAPHSASDGAATVFCVRETTAINGIQFQKDASTTDWTLTIWDKNGSTWTDTKAAPATGWHSVAVTWDKASTTARFFFDGVQEGENTSVVVPETFQDALHDAFHVGSDQADANRLESRIDELLITQSAASADEIKAWDSRSAPFHDDNAVVPADIAGAPTNNPSPSALSQTTTDTGQRRDKTTWTYTQPGFTESARPADGFIIYYENGNTSTPSENEHMVGVAVRDVTFQWSHDVTVSYAIAAFRRTRNGVEVGTKQTSASSPDWQGINSSGLILTAGLGASQVTDAKINDMSGGKLTNSSVGDSKISDMSGGKLTNSSVTNAKISDLAATKITGQIVNAQILTVDWAKITSVSIVNADIVSLDAGKINTGTLAAARLSTAIAYITNTAMIANAIIETANIKDLNVTTLKLASGAVTTGGYAFNSTLSGNQSKGVWVEVETLQLTGIVTSDFLLIEAGTDLEFTGYLSGGDIFSRLVIEGAQRQIHKANIDADTTGRGGSVAHAFRGGSFSGTVDIALEIFAPGNVTSWRYDETFISTIVFHK